MCSEGRNNMYFISFYATSKDYKQGCWPLTGNLARVLNVEHKLYTSCPQSKQHRAATQQFNSPRILHTDISADIKKYLQPTLAKAAPSFNKASSMEVSSSSERIRSLKAAHIHFHARGKKPLNPRCLRQLGFISHVVLRDWKKRYHWKHSIKYSWCQ